MRKNKIFGERVSASYIDTRYPVHWPTRCDKESAVNGMKFAQKIRGWVKNALK
jgi:HEPN domain-containing protein